MLLFFDPAIAHDIHYLSEEESYHCIKVLRLRPGNRIHITNGKGDIFESVITGIEKKVLQIRIEKTIHEYGLKPFKIHVAIAPTKNIDRFEWFLEKATEIGIDEITPLICDRSERTTIKNERQERVIIAAMKQSLKAYKPLLNFPVSMKNFISKPFIGFNKFIAVCESDTRQLLRDCCQKDQNYLILIGPEGDFAPDELAAAKRNNFKPVSLGTSRLRTETAGIVACQICNLINED
jgi:16S rRNA (uracil1498-N3)-methyltransferase